MATKEELLAEVKANNVEVPEGSTKADIQALLDDHSKSQPDAKSDGANDEDQTVAAQADGIDGVDRDHTPAGTTEEANQTDASERIQPPVAAKGLRADSTDEAYDANNQVNPALTPSEVKEGENEDNAKKVETRKAEAKEIETELGTSTEEAAAARSGVEEVALNNPVQNREPKNVFEESNQKVTEEERQAAQEVSDMTTEDREEESPTPAESARTDAERTAATNSGDDLVQALKALSGEKNFKIQADETVEPRFAVVRNKDGEVMLRENATGHLSKVQLESLEEKEASIQNQDVEEV